MNPKVLFLIKVGGTGKVLSEYLSSKRHQMCRRILSKNCFHRVIEPRVVWDITGMRGAAESPVAV